MFFTKYTLFAEKNVLWKKKFIEKNINENVKKYTSFQRYIFTQKMFTNLVYKSFLNIYSFCKKKIFLIIKNIFVKTSLRTQ